MSKDDVEIPREPPRKRRQLEQALPQWLAVWAGDESLPPSARKRAQAERDRRKRLNPDPVALGVLVDQAGATPAQMEFIRDVAHEPGVERVIAPMPVKLGLAPGVFEWKPDVRSWDASLTAIVREATAVVAAPKETQKPDAVAGVWDAVRYAKHRSLPVRVVMPDGTERG